MSICKGMRVAPVPTLTGEEQMTSTKLGKALITGASSGIGAIYADRLARRGYDLVLVARSEAKLQALADRISADTGRKVETVAADLTKSSDLVRVEAILAADPDITLLVNNAGVGATAPLLVADIGAMEDLLALNVNAPTRLAYAAAPAFVARGKGTIVNIASAVAIAPELLNGVYGGSKAYLLAFSQSLHHELAAKGVRIQTVLPGATATAFWDVAGTSVDQLPGEIVMTADDLVDSALAGFDLGELVTIPSLPDSGEWERYDDARRAMTQRLSLATPAERYRQADAVAA